MDTEQRVERLEVFAEDVKVRLVCIETRLNGMQAHMATMADLALMETVAAAVAKLIH